VVRLGGKHVEAGGYDLLGVINGFGGAAWRCDEVTVRILRKPEMGAGRTDRLCQLRRCRRVRQQDHRAGIIPGGMEMMDKPAIHAVEEFVHAGYPLDVEALLIVELDGPQAEVDASGRPGGGDRAGLPGGDCRCSSSDQERLLFWAGRKRRSRRSAASAPTTSAWTAPSPVPSCRLVLSRMRELSER